MTDPASDNLRMLADSARDYVARGYGPAVRARSEAHAHGCDPARWREFAELGWLALPLPEDLQGLGGSMAEVCTICEQMGQGLVHEPFVACAVGAAGLLDAATRHGAATVRDHWGPRLAGGLTRIAADLGVQDGGPCLQARRSQDSRCLLQGVVSLVMGGAGADAYLLAAALEEGRASLFLVDGTAAGLRATPHRWSDGQVAVDLQLREVRAAEVWTGSVAQWRILQAGARHRGLVAHAAESVGLMQGAFDTTLDYLKTRRQFGRSIASNQVVQHRLVDLHIEIAEARALVQATAALLDADGCGAVEGVADSQRHRAALSAIVAAAARHVWEEAVQLHGAIGMTQECPLAPYVQRLAVAANAHGHADVHLEDLAALVLDAPAALPA